MRAGINMAVTENEAAIILSSGSSSDEIAATVKKIILDGRFDFSGESYIPQPCVEQHNYAYDTHYDANDIDFELDICTRVYGAL
jgi:hypothetical protein